MKKVIKPLIAACILLTLLFPLAIHSYADSTAVSGAIDYFADDFDISAYVDLDNTNTKGLKIECNVWPTDETVNEYYVKMAKVGGYYGELTTRTTAGGDVLCIDYVGSINGKEVDSAKNALLTLSNDSGFVDGFDIGLYGIMPGATVTNKVEYPSDYEDKPELAGKTVEYKITVKYICDYRFTNNDVYVYTQGKYSSVEELKRFIAEYLAIESLTSYDTTLYGIVSDEVVVRTKLIDKPFPQDQIDFYVRWTKANSSTENTDEELEALARITIREDIALAAALYQRGIRFDDALYSAEAEAQAKLAGVSVEELEEYFGGADYCRIALMKDYAIRTVLAESEVTTDRDIYAYLIEDSGTETTDRITYDPTVPGAQSNTDGNLIIIGVSAAIGAVGIAVAVIIITLKNKKRR